MSEIKYLYRINEEQDPEFFGVKSKAQLVVMRYRIVKETPCGVWISFFNRKHAKFVCLRYKSGGVTTKRFACLTIEEARISFIKRKQHHILHLQAQLDLAKDGLNEANRKDFDKAEIKFSADAPIFYDCFHDCPDSVVITFPKKPKGFITTKEAHE